MNTMVAPPVRDSLARITAEAHRAWDSLSSIPDGHPLFLIMLAKAYRLGALASGASDAAATAYAQERMANWHALAESALWRGPAEEITPIPEGEITAVETDVEVWEVLI